MRTNNEIREKIVKMYLEGYSVAKIMDEVSFSRRTIYKVLDDAGVTSTERQERDADVLNITLTDAAVVQWLRSQPNAAEAIAKLVYSQIEGSPEKSKIQEQKSRIADSRVEYRTIDVIFYDAIHKPIGGESVIINIGSEDLLSDIITELRNNKYPQAVEAFYDGCKYRIVF